MLTHQHHKKQRTAATTKKQQHSKHKPSSPSILSPRLSSCRTMATGRRDDDSNTSGRGQQQQQQQQQQTRQRVKEREQKQKDTTEAPPKEHIVSPEDAYDGTQAQGMPDYNENELHPEPIPVQQPWGRDTPAHPPLPTAPSRVTHDTAIPTRLTPALLDAVGMIAKVNPASLNNPRTELMYNQQSGAHPSAAFFLYPNPYTTEKSYYPALSKDLLQPRYTYNDQRDGLLDQIRGPHYTPQLGQSHMLLQGKMEFFRPITYTDHLQYVIQAPEPSFVERHVKHRDRLQFDDKGRVVETFFPPGERNNQYFTSPEHVQVQTKNGDLCVDYQLEHVFYDKMNQIVVSHKEQHDRLQLEYEYDSYLQHKSESMNDKIQEYKLRQKIESNFLHSSGVDRTKDQEYQRFLEFEKVKHLQQELQQIGGLRPKKQVYWDYSVMNIKVSRADVHKFVRYTGNNNKLLYSDRYARFHGHNGTLVPTELLATLALDRVSDFAAQFVPPEPKIFEDVKYEAQFVQMEHLKHTILDRKQEEFAQYYKRRTIRRKAKQNARYEEMQIDLQVELDKLREEHDERKEKGKALSLFGKLNATRSASKYQEKLKKLPLPEEIEVSDSEEDPEFRHWRTLDDVELNDKEVDYIKKQVEAPDWFSVFHHPRRFLFRNLCPAEFPPQRAGEELLQQDPSTMPFNDNDPNNPNTNTSPAMKVAQKILDAVQDDSVTLHFYARVLNDKFDYSGYGPIIRRAQEQFEETVQKVQQGVLREEDLDLSKMISFEDLCRDKPLDIEVWFDLPPPPGRAAPAASAPPKYPRGMGFPKGKEEPDDPKMRPTPGTRCFYGIITYDSPYQFSYMDLDEDQMKKLFAFRQGVSIAQ